jgi:uncharacterized protein
MKRTFRLIALLVALVIVASFSHAQVYPQPRGFVNDYANLLSVSEVQRLDALCLEVKQKADIELAYVTMDSIPEGQAISLYTVELGHEWGVGTKGTDRGGMVLYSTGRADGNRQVFFATGYGLEGDIPDGYAGQIRDQVLIPYLREGKVFDAFAATTVAIVQRVEPNVQLTGAPQYQRRALPENEGPSLIGLLVMIGIFILMSSSRFGRTMLFGMLLGSLMGGHRGRWGGGSGFGGGGFGGGFGGFGGGGFGGGGAGGSF